MTVCPTSGPLALVDLEAPAYKGLIARAFSPCKVVPLAEKIFVIGDEAEMVRHVGTFVATRPLRPLSL